MRSKTRRIKYIDQIRAELSEILGASPDALTDRQLREYMRSRLQLMAIQGK